MNRRDVNRRRHPRSHLRRGHQRRVHLAHLRRPVRRQSPLRLRSHGPDPRLPLLRLSQEVLYVLHALLELRGAVGGIGRRGRRRASRGDGARAQARAGGAGRGSAPERGGRGADGAVALAEESLLRGAEVEAPGRGGFPARLPGPRRAYLQMGWDENDEGECQIFSTPACGVDGNR